MKKLWQKIERMSDSDDREAVLVCMVLMEAVLLAAGAHGLGSLLVPGVMMFTYAVLHFGSAQSEPNAVTVS
ncbi:MAG: hypothetical protein Q8Q92_00050 [bacterium]|nr:hypothetical protein [bacterium]